MAQNPSQPEQDLQLENQLRQQQPRRVSFTAEDVLAAATTPMPVPAVIVPRPRPWLTAVVAGGGGVILGMLIGVLLTSTDLLGKDHPPASAVVESPRTNDVQEADDDAADGDKSSKPQPSSSSIVSTLSPGERRVAQQLNDLLGAEGQKPLAAGYFIGTRLPVSASPPRLAPHPASDSLQPPTSRPTRGGDRDELLNDLLGLSGRARS